MRMTAPRLTYVSSIFRSFVQPLRSLSKGQPLKARSRAFASCSRLDVDLTEDLAAGLKVKQDRLMGDIHHTCQWGMGERWGEYVD